MATCRPRTEEIRLCSRCCRFPLLSLPAVVASRCCRFPRQALTKTFGILCFLSLLLLCTPSFAGQWVVTFTGVGTQTPTGGLTNTCTFTNSQYIAPSNPYYHLVNISGNSCGLGGETTGAETLNVTATFTWTPSAPGDTSQPPPTLDVLETGNANSSRYLINPVGLNNSADDGWGDSPSYPTPPMVGAVSTGAHLTHFTISQGQTTVTLKPRTLSVTLSWTSSQGGGAGGMGMGYSVKIDNRFILLHRDGAHGETQDANGTTHGDTIYSYLANAPLGVGSTVVQNMQVFHPYFAGPWSPNPQYAASGTESALNISWQWNPQNLSLMLGPVET